MNTSEPLTCTTHTANDTHNCSRKIAPPPHAEACRTQKTGADQISKGSSHDRDAAMRG
jgi:hypothetical protein